MNKYQQIIIISVISVLLSVVNNTINKNRISWTGEIKGGTATPALNTNTTDEEFPLFSDDNEIIHQISLKQAYQVFLSKKATFIDARYPIEYGNGHIPGAINLPSDLFEQFYENVFESIGIESPLVIYCSSSTCHLSDMLAESLLEMGHKKLMLFKVGFTAWLEAGYPAQEG